MKKVNKYSLIILLLLILPLSIYLVDNIKNNDASGIIDLRTSEESAVEYYYDIPWLSNGGFSSGDSWYSIEEGSDLSDIDEYISGGRANFVIEGDTKVFSGISGVPQPSDWTKTHNPYYSAYPDYSTTTSSGGFVISHFFDEDSNQNPTVRWERNVTISDDMSNYEITSVSLDVIVNATVTTNEGSQGDGIEGIGDIDESYVDDYQTGDYVKFTVWISDLLNNTVYRVAWNQTDEGLGTDYTSGIMENTRLETVSEDDFIRYLTSVLSTDNHQFKIIVEARIHCEDNVYTGEKDRFDSIYINTINLDFTYVNKVNSLTKASWNQIGPTFSSKKNNESNIINLIDAYLTFDYRISEDFTPFNSPNTQVLIFINNNQNPIPIYLDSFSSTQWKTQQFNVLPLISVLIDDVNFSIQLYIGDTFGVDGDIFIYIDNVNLEISYQEIGDIEQPTPIDWSPVIIALTVGIIGAIIGVVSYILYFQYPPLVRKIRSLRRKIKRGRSQKNPVDVENREGLIKNVIKERLNVLKIETGMSKGPLSIK